MLLGTILPYDIELAIIALLPLESLLKLKATCRRHYHSTNFEKGSLNDHILQHSLRQAPTIPLLWAVDIHSGVLCHLLLTAGVSEHFPQVVVDEYNLVLTLEHAIWKRSARVFEAVCTSERFAQEVTCAQLSPLLDRLLAANLPDAEGCVRGLLRACELKRISPRPRACSMPQPSLSLVPAPMVVLETPEFPAASGNEPNDSEAGGVDEIPTGLIPIAMAPGSSSAMQQQQEQQSPAPPPAPQQTEIVVATNVPPLPPYPPHDQPAEEYAGSMHALLSPSTASSVHLSPPTTPPPSPQIDHHDIHQDTDKSDLADCTEFEIESDNAYPVRHHQHDLCNGHMAAIKEAAMRFDWQTAHLIFHHLDMIECSGCSYGCSCGSYCCSSCSPLPPLSPMAAAATVGKTRGLGRNGFGVGGGGGYLVLWRQTARSGILLWNGLFGWPLRIMTCCLGCTGILLRRTQSWLGGMLRRMTRRMFLQPATYYLNLRLIG
ncbi:uncharacterized protein BJ171DRAFT_499575 [Polychytrium aggregatum]|uniref:uncharacterized protein n=1 Tax=Polychytrium aggregatum TaxID=110093 RepID=UPI0022FE6F87|nr:uncharacterized protein BJ171DRAFT_499575 [Polychytrium aggregatum]KAI9205774.1 hypothetical protein BJ171DRAFT_499575 [Polychytrium aggregatum]